MELSERIKKSKKITDVWKEYLIGFSYFAKYLDSNFFGENTIENILIQMCDSENELSNDDETILIKATEIYDNIIEIQTAIMGRNRDLEDEQKKSEQIEECWANQNVDFTTYIPEEVETGYNPEEDKPKKRN